MSESDELRYEIREYLVAMATAIHECPPQAIPHAMVNVAARAKDLGVTYEQCVEYLQAAFDRAIALAEAEETETARGKK